MRRATLCYMESVSHRELRNSSGEVLRRVAAGESVLVTNNGQPVAVLGPLGGSALDQAELRGEVRRARAPLASLRQVKRGRSTVSTADLLHDVRGQW